MSIIGVLIAALKEAGATIAMIEIAVLAVEEASLSAKEKNSADRKKENVSARNRRYYAKRHLNQSPENNLKTLKPILKPSENPPSRTRAPVLNLAEEEGIPLTGATHPISTKPSPSEKPSSRKPTARDELSEVLGTELAAEVVEHRQRIKAPIGPSSAARIAKELVASGNPQDAARMMMDRGWRGFKADWYQNSLSPQSRGPNGQHLNGNSKSAGAAFERLQKNLEPGLQFELEPSPLLAFSRR